MSCSLEGNKKKKKNRLCHTPLFSASYKCALFVPLHFLNHNYMLHDAPQHLRIADYNRSKLIYVSVKCTFFRIASINEYVREIIELQTVIYGGRSIQFDAIVY